MRASSPLSPRFALFALGLTLALFLAASEARAADPAANRPAANEVILHIDPYFGAGAAYPFRIEPGMSQRTVYLAGQLLAHNFRSVQVGADVVATIYRARPGRPDAGYDGKRLLTSTTGIDPLYDILIINRKSDGRADQGYRDLPFRVTVEAEWSTFLGGGHLHLDEYFVGQTANHLQVHDLSSVLLPGDQGADAITLHTGRYPTTSVEVTLYDQPAAKGTNARVFPMPPANKPMYSLWDVGFGDKTRSLRIVWKGQAFGAGFVPVPPMPPVATIQLLVPDVKGFWENNLGMRYVVGTNGSRFAWKLDGSTETGEGEFKTATDVEVRWTAADGSKHGPVAGKVERDAAWRATRFVFANGVVLTRASSQPTPPPTPNLSGVWTSNYGQVDIQHAGSAIQGTLHYPGGGTASLKGTIQGQTIAVTWTANAQAHGTGTFTISPDGKRLAGPFEDVVSHAKDTWVLTR